MKAPPLPRQALHFTGPSFAPLVLAAAFLASAIHARADRFIVPTDSSPSYSPPSSPPPSPPPSSGGGGGGGDNSYTPPPSSMNPGGGRFIVPTPGHPSYSGGGGGPGGHGGHYHNYYDPFWGGCYYWGGNYYYWGGHYYSPSYGRYGYYRDRFAYDYSTVPTTYEDQRIIFFPPAPPPLGAAIPPPQPAAASTTAPRDLAAFVYEPFYAPLSTRFAQADLTKKLLQRVEAYRTSRGKLQTALIQKLDTLKDAGSEARIRELAALAAEQSPALERLEAEADALREDLLQGGLIGLFSGTGDWNEKRRWRLGDGRLDLPRDQLASLEFRVIRAAAFYQDGLSPAQRRLLREIEMELQVEAFKPKNIPGDSVENLFFFAPETARLILPDDLPPALSLKIAAYREDKSRLKTELRDAIYTFDSLADSKRTQALKKLAESQAPHIATLEGLAEEIRHEFARLPNPPGLPTAPAFPPALSARVTAYQAEKTGLQKNLQDRLDQVRNASGDSNLRVVSKEKSSHGPGSLRIEVSESEKSDEVISAARKAIETFNRENSDRLAALGKEREAIRAEVARFATDNAAAGKSVETLLNDFYSSLREGERWQHYRYYQIAMLQPGLSPEQRRLLFEVALERLNLPLPSGEYPP